MIRKGPGKLVSSLVAIFCSISCLWAQGTARPSTTASQLPASAIAHFQAAEAAQNRKDYAQAIREYRTVIAEAPGFAPAYMNLGLTYQAEEQRPEAVKLLKTAAELDPGLFGAQFFLGMDECLQGEPGAAIPHLEAALRLRPGFADAYAWLAAAQKMNGDLDGEVKTLERGLRDHPDDTDMLYLLGRAYEALGRLAIDHLQQSNPDSSYVEQWLAEDYAQSGYSGAALLHLQNAMAASPNCKGLHLEAGQLYLGAGNMGRALAEFNAELRVDPVSLAACVRHGEVELLEGNISEALSDWTQALARDPSRVMRLLEPQEEGMTADAGNRLPASLMPELGAAKAQLGNFNGTAVRAARAFIAAQEGDSTAEIPYEDPAAGQMSQTATPCTAGTLAEWLREDRANWVDRCRDAVAQIPLQPSLRADVARALVIEGHPAEALRVLTAASAGKETVPSLYYWRARCYKILAVRSYLQLLSTAPNSSRAHQLLGDLALAQDQDANAIAEYRKALEQDPALPDLHYEIGHLLWKQFETSEARKQFQSELSVNPRHAGALLDMGATYLYEHQPAKGLEFLTCAENLDPANPTAHEFLGTAYFQLRRYTPALAELEKAAPSDKDGRVHYQLGKVWQGLGKKEAAEKEFAAATRITLASHRQNEERLKRLNAADASLRQP
jgi:tetratricopeptide (TPR) repeat protein